MRGAFAPIVDEIPISQGNGIWRYLFSREGAEIHTAIGPFPPLTVGDVESVPEIFDDPMERSIMPSAEILPNHIPQVATYIFGLWSEEPDSEGRLGNM